jgi:hypothetical protein
VGPEGPPGETIIDGTGPPTAADGELGDYYLDGGILYGPKSDIPGAEWPVAIDGSIEEVMVQNEDPGLGVDLWYDPDAEPLVGAGGNGPESDAGHNTTYGVDAAPVVTGTHNTAVGDAAGKSLTTGILNTAIGYGALQTAAQANTIQNFAVAIGANAGGTAGAGDSLVAIGVNARAATGAIAIGTNAEAQAAGSVALGGGVIVTQGNLIQLGMPGTHNVQVSKDPVAPLGVATKQYVDSPPGAIVYLESLSVATGVAANPAFVTELRDVGGFHAASASQLIVPAGAAGVYEIKGSCLWDGFGHTPPTSTIRLMQLQINATYVGVGDDIHVSTTISDAWLMNWSVELPLAVGDALNVILYQTSGISLGCSKIRLSCRRVAI